MAIAHVQDKYNHVTSTSSVTVTITTTAGNAMLATFNGDLSGNNPVSISSISDSAGNEWTYSTSQNSSSPPFENTYISSASYNLWSGCAYCTSGPGGSGSPSAVTSVTITFSRTMTAGEIYAAVSEFSGIPAGTGILAADIRNTSTTGTSWATPSVSVPGAAAVIGTCVIGGAAATSVGSPWTLIQATYGNAWEILTSSGTAQATFSGGTSEPDGGGAIMAVGPSSGTTVTVAGDGAAVATVLALCATTKPVSGAPAAVAAGRAAGASTKPASGARAAVATFSASASVGPPTVTASGSATVAAAGRAAAASTKPASASRPAVAAGRAAGASTKPAAASRPAVAAISAAATASAPGPSVVQQVSHAATSNYGMSSVTMSTTAGNGIVVFAGWAMTSSVSPAPVPVVYPADSAGNIWYHLATSGAGGYGSRSAIWCCPNARSVEWVSVATTGYVDSLAFVVVEFSDFPDFSVTDVSSTAFVNEGGPSVIAFTSGSGTWQAPPGVTSVQAQCWGGGGSGAGGKQNAAGSGGGGGGEFAEEPTLAVTAGSEYGWDVGIGGHGPAANTAGTIGGATTMAGDSVTVTAHGGAGGHVTGSGGSGGTGSSNTIHHNGGAGGTSNGDVDHGVGGGGSGGTDSAGTAGTADSKTGAPAVTNGGPGGNGGNSTAPFYGYVPNGTGGGGGGGGVNNSNAGRGGSGATGAIVLTYQVTAPTELDIAGTTGTADVAFTLLAAGSGTASLSSGPGSPWVALDTVAAGPAITDGTTIFPYWMPSVTPGTNIGVSYEIASEASLSGVLASIESFPATPTLANPSFPNLKVEIAEGFTPGDPSATPPTWTDITARCIGKDGDQFISVTYGQEYELSTPEAGTLVIGVLNNDGAFTPGNPASPYTIVLGMPVRVSAYWGGSWYPVAFGYLERVPQEWPDLPQWGLSKMTATDAIAVLNSATMPSALQGDILIDAPYVYLPCGEQYLSYQNGFSAATGALSYYSQSDPAGLLAANYSRVNQRAGMYADGTGKTVYEAQTGSALNLSGDQGTGMGNTSVSGSVSYSSPVTGPGVIYQDMNLPDPLSGTSGLTVEIWFVYDVAETSGQGVTLFSAFSTSSSYWPTTQYSPTSSVPGPASFGISLISTTNEVQVYLNGTAVNAGTFTPSQNPQQIVVTFPPDGSTALDVYLNGALLHTATLSAGETANWSAITGGCPQYAFSANPLVQNYVIGHIAVYPYCLSAGRVSAHYTTGSTGASGVTVTSGVSRILAWGGLGLPKGGPVSFNGANDGIFMGPYYSLDGSSAQDGINASVLSDGGMVYAAPTGVLTVLPRWALFNGAPLESLGDATDGSMVPYLGDQAYDYDNTYLYNIVAVTRQDGPDTSITATIKDLASQAAYFTRSALQQTISTTSDLDAYTLSQWELQEYSQPQIRVRQLTIDAASNPTQAFPAVLLMTVADVVTVTRTPVGGAQISGNFLIQKVSHRIGPTSWRTSLQISPYSQPGSVLALDDSGWPNGPGNNVLGAGFLS